VWRRKLYPAAFVGHLTEAMKLRHMADYNDNQLSRRRATKVVAGAAEFVSRVKEVVRDA
jgi:uncharacterized protein (UPF0332 family)